MRARAWGRLGSVIAAAGTLASPAAGEPTGPPSGDPAHDELSCVVAPDNGTDRDAPEHHARFLTPAFVATSSTGSYVTSGATVSMTAGNTVPFAGFSTNSLTLYDVTTSPQFGVRIPLPASSDFRLLVYFGLDGGLSSGGNLGSLVGDGVSFHGDGLGGFVFGYARNNWRFGVNAHGAYGGGDAIEVANVVTGFNQNILNSSFVSGVVQAGKALGGVFLPYTLTDLRADLVAAYGFDLVTLQAAAGLEGTFRTFHPSAAPLQVQDSTLFTAPRLGFALGVDPGFLASHRFPLEFLLEYQMSVSQTFVHVTLAPSPPPPFRATENLLALGVYSSRSAARHLQLGASPFVRFGVPNTLVATGQTTDVGNRPYEFGLVTMLRYYFFSDADITGSPSP